VEEEVRIPTAQEMAQSFLLNEPSHERRELEAALAGSVKGMEESIMSESSEGGDTGTGTGIGVPAFLASFIQGVVNRLRLEVRNVHIRVETTLSDDLNDALPVTLRLKIDGAKLDRMDTLETDLLPNVERKRLVQLSGIAVDLLSPSAMSREATDQASQPPLFRSASTSRTLGSPEQSIESHRGHTTQSQAMANAHAYTLPGGQKAHEDTRAQPHKSSNSHFHDFNDSIATSDSDHFAEAVNHEGHSDFEIQPGDDNISWGSRQRMASPPADDLWKSMTSDDDLPASLILESPSLGPNAQSSRSHSLSEVKQRTPDSSHERPIRGPGSWPRLNDSTPRHRPQQSPGSWPTLDQIHRSAIEPLDQILTPATHNTNQHRPAPEDAGTDGNEPQTPPEPDDEVDSGMLSSQAFSQEEEQSIYMSAIADSPEMTIPGGWAPDTQSEISDEPAAGPTNDNAQQQDLRDHSLSIDGRASGYATPRPQTPEHLRAAQASADLEVDVRELVRIDTLSISIPSSQEGTANTDEQVEPLHSQSLARSAYGTRDMPGTFSAYSEMSSSRMRGAQSTYGQTESSYLPALAQSGSKFTSNVRVQFGTVRTQIDISTGRTLLALSSKIMRSFDERSPDKSKTQTAPNTAEHSQPSYSIQIECLRMSLKENIHNQSLASVEFSHGLIDVITEHIRLRNNADASLRIGDIAVRLGGQDLLTFNRDNASSTIPQVLPIDSPVIAVDVVRNRFLANKRPITDVNLHTASVNLCIDLAAIDETFNSFGGLSGMLELGNSMLSESGASSPTAAKAAKGVRFAGDSETTESLNPELKLNGRINAIAVTLRGAPCLIVLQTSTMKLIYREVGTIATIEHISLKGPIARDDNEVAPIMADLATVRVEFHLQPQDKDLERLLSLLTPSKDKYDSDDDILIDTLLRQRRKGSLLRAAIGDVKLKVDDWKSLTALAALSDDLAKLSAVTKYLPEDDRPGLLTLIRVKSGEARVPVNERFGVLRCTLRDLHVAHVGLPALLALAIGGVTANRLDDLDLVHALVPSAEVEGLPMVMARMLGDEEEPTIKIKLFNLGVEYSVPILLDLTDTADELDTDDLVAGIVQSVADLAMTARSPKLERLPSDLSASPTRRTNIKLLVHDSAIGLKPQKLASKAYFVLIDAHMSTLVPPEDTFSVTLELRKASLFLTDQIISHSTGNTPHGFSTTSHSNTSQRLASTLSKQGCVSMGSIMSAKVFARVHAGELNAKVVEVKVSNELCLLETCADSTQTLIATLTALAPPTPPNKQPKYNIEPMTIEDMMASFTGDPFAKPDLPPETLFDAKADQEDEPDMLMGVSTLSMTNDLLEASGMTDSVYLPMGGDVDDHAETESTIGEEYPMTVESLLEEEDPFEMPSSPSDINLGDAALMRDLARQSKPALREESIDLGLYEIEDLGFDALGSGQQALGTQHRFNGPYAGRPKAKQRQLELPFKFHLRDFHVIWHIYDGYDWQRTRDGIVEAVEQVELKAEERRARWRQSINDREEDESVIGDFLFNSIYIGVPADHDAQELRRQINRNIDEQISETESIPVSGMSRPTVYSASGQPRRQRQRRRLKLGRSKNHKIAFELKGVSADVLVFPPDSGEVVSSIDLRVKDFEIFDKVPTSTWRKFLTHMDNDPDTREMAKPMFHIQLDNVKTLESHSASEIVLKVTVLPLRLHVDQDALDFITRFFEFKDESTMSTEPAGERPFLQRVEIDTVDMCLDYKPKNVDYVGLRSGRTTEFMNFITLDASMIRLKHAIVYGLRGFETLHQTLNDVWMPDIQRNQLPGILAGLAPVRSLVNLGSGMRDVVAIPVREYKKDGRIVRSIQKGAFHFGKTTASELARLGAKVALGTQTMLTNAEHFLSPAELASSSSTRPSSARSTSWHDVASDEDEPEQRAISAYANQPLGVFAGLRSARRYLEHDLLTAKDALIAVRGEFLESRGPGGVASAVARHAPTVLLRPVIGATRAVGTTLLGVGNQIDRDNLRKMDDVSRHISTVHVLRHLLLTTTLQKYKPR
jgi:autophagy-related protein 2